MKKLTALIGSMVINLMLGGLIAAVFSATPTAQAEEVACAVQQAQHATPDAGGPRHEHGYLVEVRMGWAAG